MVDVVLYFTYLDSAHWKTKALSTTPKKKTNDHADRNAMDMLLHLQGWE